MRIQGTKGEVVINAPAYRPVGYRVVGVEGGEGREVECEIPGWGMFWEADECGRCVRDVSGFFFGFLYPLPHFSFLV